MNEKKNVLMETIRQKACQNKIIEDEDHKNHHISLV